MYYPGSGRAVDCAAVRFCASRSICRQPDIYRILGKYLLWCKITKIRTLYMRLIYVQQHRSKAEQYAHAIVRQTFLVWTTFCFGGKNILARRHLWYAAGPTLSCLPLRQARRERHGRRGRQNCSVKGYGFAEGVCGFCRGLPSVIFTACYEADQLTFPKQTGPSLDCLCAQSSTLSNSMQVINFTTAVFSTNNFSATVQHQTH